MKEKVRCDENEKGEWRVFSDGIDNDNDGRFNEDGVGGLDINRNWPSQWQQENIQGGAGPYPLSEPETRAVAEFLLSHPNVTGLINHHMAGNFVYRPPTALHFDPVTGVEEPMASDDVAVFEFFGSKLYNSRFETYTNLMCTPGPAFEDFLIKHTKWNLWMASMSPSVQLTDVTATPEESGYYRVTANVQNQGYFPTNVTQQAILNETAKTVLVSISLDGADLVFGDEIVDIGHLQGNRSLPVTVEWLIKVTARRGANLTVKSVSEKGGTDTETVILR